MKLRVACIQYNPIIGSIESNKSRIRTLISNLLSKVNEIDLLILPELSITGYNFKSENEITPYLDDDLKNTNDSQISTNFAKELLTSNNCFTVIGLPENKNNKIFNSCKLINPLGELIYNYHKTFLYEADEAWGCSENPNKNFQSIDVILDKKYYSKLQNNIGTNTDTNTDTNTESDNRDISDNGYASEFKKTRINFGICMDLNPYKFEAPFNKFEFSSACYYNKSSLIICPMAWLSPFSPSINKELPSEERLKQANKIAGNFKTLNGSKNNQAEENKQAEKNKIEINSEIDNDSEPYYNLSKSDNQQLTESTEFTPSKPDLLTINYHILRFFPFMNHKYNELPKYGNVNIITCNRIGVENDIIYGGSSSIFTFKNIPGNDDITYLNPSVELHGYLPQGMEGILYRELEI